MSKRPPEPDEPRDRDPDHGQLVPELQGQLERHGKDYARATARDFAKGGKYNPRARRRYALT